MMTQLHTSNILSTKNPLTATELLQGRARMTPDNSHSLPSNVLTAYDYMHSAQTLGDPTTNSVKWAPTGHQFYWPSRAILRYELCECPPSDRTYWQYGVRRPTSSGDSPCATGNQSNFNLTVAALLGIPSMSQLPLVHLGLSSMLLHFLYRSTQRPPPNHVPLPHNVAGPSRGISAL
ncbi:hypothetical protein BJV77DRAFT_410473 [Russula vinacea]|nr:hypothetical protein BJV77DRAFT_410473 [Russula vinacea]